MHHRKKHTKNVALYKHLCNVTWFIRQHVVVPVLNSKMHCWIVILKRNNQHRLYTLCNIHFFFLIRSKNNMGEQGSLKWNPFKKALFLLHGPRELFCNKFKMTERVRSTKECVVVFFCLEGWTRNSELLTLDWFLYVTDPLNTST